MPGETVTAIPLASLFESFPSPTESVAIVGQVLEVFPAPADTYWIRAGVSETFPVLVEFITAVPRVLETFPTPTDLNALVPRVLENMPSPSDAVTMGASVLETPPAPVELVTGIPRAILAETMPAPVEAVTMRGNIAEAAPVAADTADGTILFIRGATTAAGANWTTPTNAQGLRDTNNAVLSDTITATTSGTLTLDPYPDPAWGTAGWTITLVEFWLYGSGVFSALTTALLHFEWSKDGTNWTTLESLGTDFTNTAVGSPRVYNVTAGITGFTNINNLRFRCRYVTTILAETATINIDAVILRVTATKAAL